MPVHTLQAPLQLESGQKLERPQIAYSISGTPLIDGSNVVVVCHTLTGGIDVVESPVWWFVGPGQLIDTNVFCVVSMATLGSWYGSSSPYTGLDLPDQVGDPISFPTVTVTDSINAHRQVLAQLGITRARLVIGGSFGGFCAYTWLLLEPDLFDKAFIFQSSLRCSAHTIAFFSLARELICSDPLWQSGRYQQADIKKMTGVLKLLGLNRLMQMSHAFFEKKFPPSERCRDVSLAIPYFEPFSSVDDFMLSGPNSLTGLDPNALLCTMRSSSLFDLERTFPDLWERWSRVRTEVVQIPCTQDWRYPVEGMREIHDSLCEQGLQSHLIITESRYGHGSFLHDPSSLKPFLPFLASLICSEFDQNC